MDINGNTYKTSSVSGKVVVFCSLVILMAMTSSCNNSPAKDPDIKLKQKAERICQTNLILDSHIDWPDAFLTHQEDISTQTSAGDFDLIRARKGGLDAVFSVAYISPDLDTVKGRLMVDSMLNIIRHYPVAYPDKFALSTTPGEVRSNF